MQANRQNGRDPSERGVVYVDTSPAGRRAFITSVGGSIRPAGSVREALASGAAIAVVRWGRRGGGEATLVDLCAAGLIVVVVVARERIEAVEDARERGLADGFIGLPASVSEIRFAIDQARRIASLQTGAVEQRLALADRDRLGALAILRGKVLHDLANLATAATVTVELSARSGAATGEDLADLGEICRLTQQLHLRARSLHGTPKRWAQRYVLADVVETAMEIARLSASQAPEVDVDCPPDLLIWADRTDVARVIALAIAQGTGGRLGVRAYAEGADAVVVVSAAGADPDGLPMEIAREMVRLNGGRLSRTGEGFVLRMPRFPPPAVPAEEAAAFSL